MLLPYRVKNPPERPPYISIVLILLLLGAFFLTSDSAWFARQEFVQEYAVSRHTLSPLRLVSALFLHGGSFLLLVNLLGLGMFGLSVEGRARSWGFLALFLLAGVVSNALCVLVFGSLQPNIYFYGASGAVMGVAGAYLYLFPYSTVCVFYWRGLLNFGTTEWPACWAVWLYVAIDLLTGVFAAGGNRLGSLAHLAAFGLGYAAMALFQVRRDSEDFSFIRAAVTDTRDYALLHLADLEKLLSRPTEDMNLVMAYCEKAVSRNREATYARCLSVLHHYSRSLMERADAMELASVVLAIPPRMGGLPVASYLHLGARLETGHQSRLAAQIYRLACDLSPDDPDVEIALYRLGVLTQKTFHNVPQAQAIFEEMQRRFPNGRMTLEAQRALQRI